MKRFTDKIWIVSKVWSDTVDIKGYQVVFLRGPGGEEEISTMEVVRETP